jgi:hypothetical protein
MAFVWRGRGKPRKTSVSIASVPAEIRTEHLSNTNRQRYHSINLLGRKSVNINYVSTNINNKHSQTSNLLTYSTETRSQFKLKLNLGYLDIPSSSNQSHCTLIY